MKKKLLRKEERDNLSEEELIKLVNSRYNKRVVDARYRDKNREKRRAKDRDYYKRNAEKIKAYKKEYALKNKDKLNAKARERYHRKKLEKFHHCGKCGKKYLEVEKKTDIVTFTMFWCTKCHISSIKNRIVEEL